MFIAGELAQAVRRQVEEIQASLRTATTDVSCVRPENFHLTLKFLGPTAAEKVGFMNNQPLFRRTEKPKE